MTAERLRVHAVVRVRVQGVSFRAATQAEARRLDLTGWVRNLSDGSVELEAQGRPARVASLLAFCGHGPPAARVDEVSTRELAVVEGEAGFAVRRG